MQHLISGKPAVERGDILYTSLLNRVYGLQPSLLKVETFRSLLAIFFFSKCMDIGITEMYWDVSPDWSAALGKYRLFKNGRPGRQGQGVVFCVGALRVCEALPWNEW